jgi:peroxiredoxin
MALLESNDIALGSKAPGFELEGVDGAHWSLEDFDADVLVVMFICNHCPYVKAVQGRLVELAEEMSDRSVDFVAINPNVEAHPEDTFPKMKETAEDWGLPFPYLADRTQEVARAYRAVCTPDIYVYDADRKLAYHGRVDDNWEEPEKVERRELKQAIETVLKGGRPDPKSQQPSMGCSIKWLDEQ